MALVLWPWGTSRLYWKLVRNHSCSTSILSYVVGAPAVTSSAVAAIDSGKSSGSSR